MNNEPVAWINRRGKNGEHGYLEWDKDDDAEINTPLYTHPVKELTDEEIEVLASKHLCYQIEGSEVSGVFEFAKAILRKAQEK